MSVTNLSNQNTERWGGGGGEEIMDVGADIKLHALSDLYRIRLLHCEADVVC